MGKCLSECPCNSTEIAPIDLTFDVSPFVAEVGDPSIYAGCPVLECEENKCLIDVLVPVCPENDIELACSVKVYSLTFTGTAHFIVSVPVSDGETCPLPEALTFDIPVDIGTQICYYCEDVCCPELDCGIIEIEDLQVFFDDENSTIRITGNPVFNCPGR